MAKLSVFVACPYTLFPLDDYKKAYDAVARAYGVVFKFADEQITNKHVLDKIKYYIVNNDISLFDVTGWNPNVALELGIAIGAAKNYYILLNTKFDQSKDVPSDIKGIDRIQYSSNGELEAKLQWLIKQLIPQQPGSVDSIFENMKSQIHDALQREPGLGLTRLASKIGQDKRLVQSAAQVMTQSGELRREGAKKGTIYFVTMASSGVADIQDKILEALEKSPGLGVAKLAEAIAQNKQLVKSAVHAMVQDKKLKTKGEKRGMVYFTAKADLRKMRGLF